MVLGWGWRWGGYVHVLVLRDNARGSALPRSRSEGNSTARRPLSKIAGSMPVARRSVCFKKMRTVNGRLWRHSALRMVALID